MAGIWDGKLKDKENIQHILASLIKLERTGI